MKNQNIDNIKTNDSSRINNHKKNKNRNNKNSNVFNIKDSVSTPEDIYHFDSDDDSIAEKDEQAFEKKVVSELIDMNDKMNSKVISKEKMHLTNDELVQTAKRVSKPTKREILTSTGIIEQRLITKKLLDFDDDKPEQKAENDKEGLSSKIVEMKVVKDSDSESKEEKSEKKEIHIPEIKIDENVDIFDEVIRHTNEKLFEDKAIEVSSSVASTMIIKNDLVNLNSLTNNPGNTNVKKKIFENENTFYSQAKKNLDENYFEDLNRALSNSEYKTKMPKKNFEKTTRFDTLYASKLREADFDMKKMSQDKDLEILFEENKKVEEEPKENISDISVGTLSKGFVFFAATFLILAIGALTIRNVYITNRLDIANSVVEEYNLIKEEINQLKIDKVTLEEQISYYSIGKTPPETLQGSDLNVDETIVSTDDTAVQGEEVIDETPPASDYVELAEGEFYIYTVVEGDNFWNISKKVFGEGHEYEKILEANNLEENFNLKIGYELKIPN